MKQNRNLLLCSILGNLLILFVEQSALYTHKDDDTVGSGGHNPLFNVSNHTVLQSIVSNNEDKTQEEESSMLNVNGLKASEPQTARRTNLRNGGRSRIINGIKSTITRHPHQVAIQKKNKPYCGGALVRKDIIITACHCLVSGYKSLSVVAGTEHHRKLGLHGQRLKVKKGICHPDHKKGKGDNGDDNDIAVLRVQHGGFEIDGVYKKLIDLPEKNVSLKSGTRCWVSGWGTVDKNQVKIPDILQEAVVPLVSTESCMEGYGKNTIKSSQMLCAGKMKGGVDTCQGDSGGPLACDADRDGTYELQGVVSWGRGCADKNTPGVYARVSSYIDWILETIEELSELP